MLKIDINKLSKHSKEQIARGCKALEDYDAGTYKIEMNPLDRLGISNK